MMEPNSHLRLHQRGFTLMEAVIVLLVLALAGTAIVALQTKLFTNQSTVKSMQVGSRLLLECAEEVLATRRAEGGYDAVKLTTVTVPTGFGPNACGTVTALADSGFSVPTVAFTDPYTGDGCPSGLSCKRITITAGSLSSATLLLVDY